MELFPSALDSDAERCVSPSFPRIKRRFREKSMTGHDSRGRTDSARSVAPGPAVDNTGGGCTRSVAPARPDARVRERERERGLKYMRSPGDARVREGDRARVRARVGGKRARDERTRRTRRAGGCDAVSRRRRRAMWAPWMRTRRGKTRTRIVSSSPIAPSRPVRPKRAVTFTTNLGRGIIIFWCPRGYTVA